MLLLMMFFEARTLPALDTAPIATAANTIEESDKQTDANIETNALNDAGLVNANGTSLAATSTTEAQDPTVVSKSKEPKYTESSHDSITVG